MADYKRIDHHFKIEFPFWSRLILTTLFFGMGNLVFGQNTWSYGKVNTQPEAFTTPLNHQISPYTGMTREHWKEAGHYLLAGAFSYIHQLDDEMEFPKQPGKSYPKNDWQKATEKLEGLCRTMFIATPLLKENPALKINGISVADYYRHQLTRMLDSTSSFYTPRLKKNGGPGQTLVEFGGLAVSLFAAPEVYWDPLPQSTKDALASTMLSYGNGPTIDMNWRFFNIFILSFFKSQGYQVREDYLQTLLQQSLKQYDGDGWYNDRPYYDYYSVWAFQMYGTLWSQFYGSKYAPELAAQFHKNLAALSNNYPQMFGRNGEMIMWGRSITYRMAAAVPFPMMGFLNDPEINYGWARRIASGTLMQFLQNPDWMEDNIPTLGFYGAFEPGIQQYSCRGSSFWMGKLFLGLLVPKDNTFWTATENEGDWTDKFEKDKVYNHFLPGPKMMMTNYPAIGASEIRAWCNSKTVGYYEGTENYNRLSYNSAFPWQADGENGEVSMNYVFQNANHKWEALRMFSFDKYQDEIYYRKAVLASDTSVKVNLADITLPNGILRVDTYNGSTSVKARLGNYSLPQIDQPIVTTTKKVKGKEVKIIDNGIYQLAMVPVYGWENTTFVSAKGLNPVKENSTTINVDATFNGNQNATYSVLMLWKRSGEKWSKKDLMPIKDFKISTDNKITFKLNKELKRLNWKR